MADLIVGNEYYFRVFSENVCGLSESPGVSKTTARILKSGTATHLSRGWDLTVTTLHNPFPRELQVDGPW